jgi:hypothetical protein
MKKAALFAGGIIVIALAAFVLAEEPTTTGEEMWFDMQNCAFCKNLVKDPNLMTNMTWEHHDISNGVMTITTVKPESKPAYFEAMAAMMDLGKKLESGEVKATDIHMCNHCIHYGELAQIGAKMEYVQGKAADVVLMTSDKPEIVAKIKAFAQRNREELAKLEAAEKAKKTN